MHKLNWDDLRFVLAVVDAGSVSAAAKLMGVNHATVLRRVGAVEEAAGQILFDRTAQGYRIIPDQLAIIDAMREAEGAIGAVNALLKGHEARLTGRVRVTSTDTFCQYVLPEVIAEITAREPELSVDLQSNNLHIDLSRMHADISVRPTIKLGENLIGEPAGQMAFAVYEACERAREVWLAPTGALTRSAVSGWIEARDDGLPVRSGADSFIVMREMAAAGMGRVVLPAILGEGDARLRQMDMAGAASLPKVPIWVISHQELAHAPRLRRLRRQIAEGLLARAELFDPQIG
ncbi:LysR family transcriptional regulator [Pelagovum sp. HNIBRBA483]|uniref:LysR family transcriptional regulator n=1 Tax=Pelagovum sp. HNIBRBA483 TaxID=3233341 RepID=UPI0034A452CA